MSIEFRFRFVNNAALSLQWRHNGRDGVLNHQCHDCLLKRLFRLRSKKTSKLRVTGLCEGNSPVKGEFPAQKASNAENVSIRWRRHVLGHPIPKMHTQCIHSILMSHVMTSKCFHITGPLWGESTDNRWFPLTKDQWCGALIFSTWFDHTTC